ncbi:unnamed protein product [Staurois parvus]|uniref:Uncharacterized protein n=1 Tax=Staurois parvus TaxID=386267 RepID=A0ABN9DDH6_9NEOB|nr:unnamed protein product [Staurois parvus]
MAQALRGTTGSYTPGTPWGGSIGQCITRVVGAHSGDSSGRGWLVHTAGTVQDVGGWCTQRGQFRTWVVGAHSGDSSGRGWLVHTAGLVQDVGGWCTQQGQFRTFMISNFQTLSNRRLQTGTTSG